MVIAGMNIHYRWFRLDQFLDDVERVGLEHIELWGGAPHFYSDDVTYKEIRHLRREFEKRKLTLVCHTPEQCMYPINIASDNRAMRMRSIDYFKRNIRIASDLGSNLMLITPGTGYANEDTALVWNHSRESLSGLVDYAEQSGVRLGLEVLRSDESNIVNSLTSLQKMVKEVNSSYLGGILDTIPMAINNETPQDYCRALKEKLFHIHFIDGTPYYHLALGDGNLDLQEYLSQLTGYGYTGALSLEITDHRYFADPFDALERSTRILSRYFMEETD